MTNEDKLLRSMILDRFNQSESWYCATYTGFLDMHEQVVASEAICGTRCTDEEANGEVVAYRAGRMSVYLYGGYEDAERRIMMFLPEEFADDYRTILADEEPLGVLHAEVSRGSRKLTHRDYLGSVLGLGLKRSVIGDIIVRDDGADIIAKSEIIPFLLNEYKVAGRTPLVCTARKISELMQAERKAVEVSDTLSSLRLDNVVSAAFSIPRKEAASSIVSGLVSVDHREAVKIDRRVDEGSTVSLKGKGKAVLTQVGETTKKKRIRVRFERFV